MHTACVIIFSTVVALFIAGTVLSVMVSSNIEKKELMTAQSYAKWSSIANGLGGLVGIIGLVMCIFGIGKGDYVL